MSDQPTVYLIDASPYIFRAYFSIPSSMTAPGGEPVNAAYGFAGFLLKLLASREVTHLALTFDRSLNTSFRNELYPDYKAQRELPPVELERQLVACEALGKAFGCVTFADQRYEADDLIATLRLQVAETAGEIVVVTSDKDLSQLVDDQVSLWDFAKDELYRPDTVEEKFGVCPEQIADYLGLAGDAVDNIPGVKGVGKKTAAAILGHFRNLDEVYERIDEVATLPIRGAKGLGKKLLEQKDIALLSRQLATLATDAPIHAQLEDLKLSGADPDLVDPLFENLGFGRIRDRIQHWKT